MVQILLLIFKYSRTVENEKLAYVIACFVNHLCITLNTDKLYGQVDKQTACFVGQVTWVSLIIALINVLSTCDMDLFAL